MQAKTALGELSLNLLESMMQLEQQAAEFYLRISLM